MIIVDRIENDKAVCEIDGKLMKNISLSKISDNVREGDILIDNNNDGSFYIIDVVKTKQRKEDITKRFERLKARNNIK